MSSHTIGRLPIGRRWGIGLLAISLRLLALVMLGQGFGDCGDQMALVPLRQRRFEGLRQIFIGSYFLQRSPPSTVRSADRRYGCTQGGL